MHARFQFKLLISCDEREPLPVGIFLENFHVPSELLLFQLHIALAWFVAVVKKNVNKSLIIVYKCHYSAVTLMGAYKKQTSSISLLNCSFFCCSVRTRLLQFLNENKMEK